MLYGGFPGRLVSLRLKLKGMRITSPRAPNWFTPRYCQLAYSAKLFRTYVSGGTIVDIGCGEGLLGALLLDYRILGLDISLPAVTAARTNFNRARFLLGDMQHLPIRGETAEGVALIAVLGAVAKGRERGVLAEAYRILKDGGHAIILVSRRSLYSAITSERLLTRWQWRHFQPQKLLSVASEVGFQPLLVTYRGGPLSVATDLMSTVVARLLMKAAGRRGASLARALTSLLNNLAEGLEFAGMPRSIARYVYCVLRKDNR